MSLKFECLSEAPIDWNSWNSANSPCPTYYQSTGMAHLNHETTKSKPIFLRVRSRGRIVCQALIMVMNYYDRMQNSKKFPFPYLDCLHGPIFSEGASSQIEERVFKFLHKLSIKNFGTYIRIIPNFNTPMPSKTSFENAGYSITKWGTYILHLPEGKDAIFKKIPSKVRNTIRKASKLGIESIKIDSWNDYKNIYVPVVSEIKKESKEYHTFHSRWTNNCAPGMLYYLAKHEENYVACLGIFVNGKSAISFGYGLTDYAMEKRLPAQDLLHWQAMIDASAIGAVNFDFAGINPDPQTPKEKGIAFFKKKWGGEYVEYPIATQNLIPFRESVATRVKNFLAKTPQL
ncbi:hypothetical protein [Maridesulfovibrio sp.]|uniref:hypothetical protein n=1 Tax=Maridesulfovibrio sp. TaxID=2795000 RepID=UPI003BA9C921